MPFISRTRPRFNISARTIEVVSYSDFSGGLCLGENLEQNESPDLCNIELGRRGGFCSRRAVRNQIDGLPSPVCDMLCCQIKDEDGELGTPTLLMALDDGSLWQSNDLGPAFSPVGAPVRTDGCCLAMTQCGSYVYVSDGETTYRWQCTPGGLFEPLTNFQWNPEFEIFTDSVGNITSTTNGIPVGGNMPPAKGFDKCFGRVFAWGVPEPGLDANLACNRIRWSWGQIDNQGAEDWDEDAALDLPNDGDEIIGIKCCPEGLYVMRRNSTYLVTEAGTVQGVPLQFTYSEVGPTGSAGPKAIECTPLGTAFWSATEGAVFYGQNENGVFQLVSIFEKLKPLLDDCEINGFSDQVAVAYCNGKLFYSVPSGDGDCPDITFVYDPVLQAWTKYDYGFRCAKEWSVPGQKRLCLVADPKRGAVHAIEQEEDHDDFGDGDQSIYTRFVSPWIDFGVCETDKRFCKSEIVGLASAQCLTVSAYGNYDPTNYLGSSFVDMTGEINEPAFVVGPGDDCTVIPEVAMECLYPGAEPTAIECKGDVGPRLGAKGDVQTVIRKTGKFAGDGRSLQLVIEGETCPSKRFCVTKIVTKAYQKSVRC